MDWTLFCENKTVNKKWKEETENNVIEVRDVQKLFIAESKKYVNFFGSCIPVWN